MTVTPAAATQLVITEQPPASVEVNKGFGLEASIEDQYANVVTTATNTVSVAFANNPTGATLGGTLSVTASQGVATFSGLAEHEGAGVFFAFSMGSDPATQRYCPHVLATTDQCYANSPDLATSATSPPRTRESRCSASI
jgi:hypothetical protein